MIFLFFANWLPGQAQQDTILTGTEAARIMNVLASDSLKGRGNLQPSLLKAADFIAREFSKNGLSALPGQNGYFFPFHPDNKSKKKKETDSVSLSALPVKTKLLYNIIGLLPGRSKPAEMILISAHYDHLGLVGRRRKDSIMNGANDNASGTTAMLMLMHYFASRGDNERTLLFCAFSGEEIGLKGSMELARQIDKAKIIANINLEMLGIPQFGKRTVFITGEQHSTLSVILRNNISPDNLKFVPEPDPEGKALYQRSDNYPFVELGIPAHSIMGSDDSDPCYHKSCDELNRIDFDNMADIILALAKGMSTIVEGKDTPVNAKF